MSTERETFLLCACCPSPCRRVISRDLPNQIETTTPSAMSMIALAVIDKQMTCDDDVLRALSMTEAIRPCGAVCPYQLDIASSIEYFIAARGQ